MDEKSAPWGIDETLKMRPSPTCHHPLVVCIIRYSTLKGVVFEISPPQDFWLLGGHRTRSDA